MTLNESRPALPVLAVGARGRAYRQPGVHLSAIIKDLALTLEPGRFGKGKGNTKQDAELDLESEPRVWLGQAFDHYLGTVLPHGVRPGGIQVDGVWMTSDYLFMTGEPGEGELTVEEWKLTWMSLRQPIDDPKWRHYFWQLLAYMRAWETTQGRLRVFAVNGDYGPPSPQYRVWEVRASEQELEDNWSMIVNHGKRRGLLR